MVCRCVPRFSEFEEDWLLQLLTGQSWAPICLNKEALWFVSSWKRVESVELRVAEPTRTRRYLLDLATAFRHTWKSLFWRWRLVWHGPGTWVVEYLIVLCHEKRGPPFPVSRPDSCESLWSRYQGVGTYLSGVAESPPNNPKNRWQTTCEAYLLEQLHNAQATEASKTWL